MRYRTSALLLSSLFSSFLFSAEPSAFGAGDISSSEPYGLTANEKVILDTKNKLNKVYVKSNNQANELDSLRERLDGLQSIIESISRKAHNNKINFQKQSAQNIVNQNNINEYEKRLSETIGANSLSIEQQKVLITDMSLLLEGISKNYVSKDEFNSLVNDMNSFKTLVAKELKSLSKKTSKPKLSSRKSSDIYNEAQKFFNKKYYTNAIKNYEYLIKKNYKPAYAHYMIGEMNFRRKNYANAITYFKQSSSLYTKASYMPTLMLHTAISMSKTGDKSHAKAFFEAVVSKYPNSTESKEAIEYLQP